MSISKTLKGLLIPLLLMGAIVSSASAAVSIRQAREKANFQQNWDCYHWFAGGEFSEWRCQSPSYKFPQCWVSALPSGRGRYLCQGQFMQKNRLQNYSRICNDRVRYTANGFRIVHSIGPCTNVSGPLARDE